ncbi:MAG: RNA polymerase sigma factor [Actinobacteria bacterium]|jgi:RNA polymerase sigma-70 factor (ECF subfamily)|nr:RNA polymerase sigma factor [Actinomycetota bacterium]
MSDVVDRDLWDRSVQGDAGAFGQIFERHARSIYNYLFRRCGDWATAEDLTSIVFLEAWRKRRKVTLEHDSALPLLFGIAVNVLRNRRRAEFRYRSALDRLSMPPQLLDDPGDLADRLADEQQMRAILAAFVQLPKREQDVVSLCIWTGLSYENAATALGIPVGTVRSRLSRGRRRLRELLGESGHEVSGNAQPQVGEEVMQ